MDLVETNDGSGESDQLTASGDSRTLNGGGGSSGVGSNPSHSQTSSSISIVHVSVPQAQVQSVIQPNTSVIQSTPSLQTSSIPKGNIILVSKPNSVIHTAGGGGSSGAIQTIQVLDGVGLQEDENTKKRREILARRPSYRKILNELGGCEISEDKGDSPGGLDSDSSSSSPAPPSGHRTGSSVSLSGSHYQSATGLIKVCVTGDLQAYALRPVTTTAGLNTSTGVVVGSSSSQSLQNSKHLAEEASREIRIMKGNSGNHSDEWDPSEPTLQKRELRLLKNREAARECRRKKKEYIKCLENRVAVLENQNKALIEELKSLKELYCSQKTD